MDTLRKWGGFGVAVSHESLGVGLTDYWGDFMVGWAMRPRELLKGQSLRLYLSVPKTVESLQFEVLGEPFRKHDVQVVDSSLGNLLF